LLRHIIKFDGPKSRLSSPDEHTAINVFRITFGHIVNKQLANRGPGLYGDGNLANVRDLEGETTGEARMDSSSRGYDETVPTPRGTANNIRSSIRRQSDPLERDA
jgi:hypothetical protein